MSRSTILLFGMPRSGTTWVGKILDSHPDTVYRHEPDAGGTLDHVPWVATAEDVPRVGDALRDFTAHLLDVHTPKAAGTMPVFPKTYCGAARLAAHRVSVWTAKAGEPFFGPIRVLSTVPASRRDEVTVVWKSIESLTRVGALVRALDSRRAVILLRHPCGQIASGLRGEGTGRFATTDRASEDYGIFRHLLQTVAARRHGLTLPRLRELSPLQRLAWKWVLVNETALDGVEGVEGCAIVRYEDICAAPLEAARGLTAFCGLGWSEQSAEFVRRSTGRHSDAYYSVFKDPALAADRWRDELTSEQVEAILAITRGSPLSRWYPSGTPADGHRDAGSSGSRSTHRAAPRSPARAGDVWRSMLG